MGPARIKGYALYNLGEYPAVRPVQEDSFVEGEVYEVPEALFSLLDQVEDEYKRERTHAELANAQIIEVELYVFEKDLPEKLRLWEGKWPL